MSGSNGVYNCKCHLVPVKTGLAFVLPYRSGVKPVSYIRYMRFRRKSIVGIGEDPSLFSTHSFRRGGATWAFKS